MSNPKTTDTQPKPEQSVELQDAELEAAVGAGTPKPTEDKVQRTASSPGTINIVFGDGSVRTVSDSFGDGTVRPVSDGNGG